MLFGLVMLLSTLEIAALIAPWLALSPEASKVGSIVRVAYAGPLSASEAAPPAAATPNPRPYARCKV